VALKLVWLVCAGENTLDHANYWYWVVWLRHDGRLVSSHPVDLHLVLFSKSRSLTPSFYSLPLQLYLVDAFTYAASALSAAAVSWIACIEYLP